VHVITICFPLKWIGFYQLIDVLIIHVMFSARLDVFYGCMVPKKSPRMPAKEQGIIE
jgi:hypothetical protein